MKPIALNKKKIMSIMYHMRTFRRVAPKKFIYTFQLDDKYCSWNMDIPSVNAFSYDTTMNYY